MKKWFYVHLGHMRTTTISDEDYSGITRLEGQGKLLIDTVIDKHRMMRLC